MQSDTLNTKPANRAATDEDAVPGFASSTAHNALVAARAPDATRLKNLASEAVGTVRDMASEAVGTVRDMAKEARTAAADQVGATAAWVGNSAKERPFRTLGIALAVGAVIGLLLSRR